MKRFLPLSFLSLNLLLPAQANTNHLVDLVLEKRVLGTLHSGNRPMIDPERYGTVNFDTPALKGPVEQVQQPVQKRPITKRYEVVQDPTSYQSLIKVQHLESGLTSHISVGRRIHKLLASPTTNRLYVLCGGYFGSIWEIDTTRDLVLRKLPAFTPNKISPPLWNPQDMVLLGDGKTLAVGSGKLQLIDLASGQLKADIALPDDQVEITALTSLGPQSVGLKTRTVSGSSAGFRYQMGQDQLQPGGHASQSSYPLGVVINTDQQMPPAISRLLFLASRNSDYIRMVDRESLMTVGILPVDFNVDSLALSEDRTRLFAYHQRFGQISVIELTNRSPEQFSVIRRFRDKRFESTQALSLASAAGKVFLWDGSSQMIAGFDSQSLYPQIGIPFDVQISGSQAVWVSMPAHQRFFLREGSLYSEYMAPAPSTLPKRVPLKHDVLDFVMSADRQKLFVLTQDAHLLAVNAITHEVNQKLFLGMQPAHLTLSHQGQNLLVVDRDQGSLRQIRSADLSLQREVVMDVGLNQPHQITLFASQSPQVIEVELPRHFRDVVRVSP